ncbi:MAG: hypothetical protein CMH34_01290 [Microbacterium sp.]|nr:hypothetical protein [Microbacterium sp.]
MALRAAEVEVLITANDSDLARAEKGVKSTGERIEKKPITAKVTADEKDALAGMDRVEDAAKKLVSERAVLKLDADIDRAEKQLERAVDKLEDLHIRAEGGLDVDADVKRAEANIQRIERQLTGLKSARTVVDVEADTSKAEAALEDVQGVAGEAGEDSGAEFGASIIAALATIPIAGAVVGIGAAAGKALIGAFNSGLQQELGRDRLAGLTGLTAEDAARISRAAGEAYANNFGESIEANMDTARLALQFDLIDEEATTKDAQKVVSGLAGIADVLGEEVQPTATAVTTLLRTGMAKSAEEAYDILATGAREGVNRNEDLLDTFTEYPVVLRRLGLDGKDMLGLLNQGLEAGARNSDVVADALKEFQIRATDASDASADGFERIGLNAEEMTAKIARGGDDAREGLEQVLTALRETEDPVARNAAAVELFGTKAEDLGEALFALDLSSAVDELDGVTGAARRMFDTLTDNDASRVQQAQRNIEVAVEGIQGALASAFSEPLGDFADWVSRNRGPVLEFFGDLVNGGLDFGASLVESAALGTEAFGEFIAGPAASLIASMAKVQDALGMDGSELGQLSRDMQDLESVTDEAADTMRDRLGGAVEEARDKFNDFYEPQVALGHLNDAALRTAEAVDALGYETDGLTRLTDSWTESSDGSVEAHGRLDAQIQSVLDSLGREIEAAAVAGESQENLSERYDTTTQALAGQLTAMGLSTDQAYALIDSYLAVPEEVDTNVSSNADPEREKIERLGFKITTLPDGSVTITANTGPAVASIEGFIRNYNNRSIGLTAQTIVGNPSLGYTAGGKHGGVVEFMAQGGIPDLVPMGQTAAVVPPNTWRVVGDRSDVAESFIPHDGSARSYAILAETMNRMGVIAHGPQPVRGGDVYNISMPALPERDADRVRDEFVEELKWLSSR